MVRIMKGHRNYRHELDLEHKKHPERVKQRAERNSARSEMMKEGKVHKGDNKDVDHVVPLSKGGSNKRSNLRVQSAHDNESFARNPDKSIKLII